MSILILIIVLISTSVLAQEGEHSYTPKNGFVPDSKTAIAIAIAVLSPIYGRDTIEKERPFKATLENGVWFVEGSLPWAWLGAVGGVAEAEISQKDTRILRVSHSK